MRSIARNIIDCGPSIRRKWSHGGLLHVSSTKNSQFVGRYLVPHNVDLRGRFLEYLYKIQLRGFLVDDIATLSKPEHGFLVSQTDFLYNIIERGRSEQASALTGRGSPGFNNLPKEARNLSSPLNLPCLVGQSRSRVSPV